MRKQKLWYMKNAVPFFSLIQLFRPIYSDMCSELTELGLR